MSDSKNRDNIFNGHNAYLRRNVKRMHLVVLDFIASMTVKSGYCSATDRTFFTEHKDLTKNSLTSSLNYLAKNHWIIRYYYEGKNLDDKTRSKRLIVLTDRAFKEYQKINNKIHTPINRPKYYKSIEEHNTFINSHKSKPKSKKPVTESNDLASDASTSSLSKSNELNKNKEDIKVVLTSPKDTNLDSEQNGIYSHSNAFNSDDYKTQCYKKFQTKHWLDFVKNYNGDTEKAGIAIEKTFCSLWNDPDEHERLIKM